MATTEQGTTHRHDEQMEKLRIRDGRIQAAPLGSSRGPSRRADEQSVSEGAEIENSERSPDNGSSVLAPDLRRNFIIPPKERALECIAVLLNLARANLGTSQRNLHASKRTENENEFAHWKWESLHWLRRCGKWSNHKRKVEAR